MVSIIKSVPQLAVPCSKYIVPVFEHILISGVVTNCIVDLLPPMGKEKSNI